MGCARDIGGDNKGGGSAIVFGGRAIRSTKPPWNRDGGEGARPEAFARGTMEGDRTFGLVE
ncbi:BQ5605_C003g01931 [Microbotryum silenes-dioicae]|uniref:BQ5605_C003g01931 protein n=1 Tax=Microbotryum silenes-dioicae TaxID=796604 RepID=A0A2X0P323_9BASI|nr:BQ5605_C003g01931 [Microbotryum silenes-dioicae]